MSNESAMNDPMDFMKSMWNSMGFSLPGMVTPTLDVDEIGKRIADLKAVEGWLKTNLNMLQMTIQGLEMQRVALMTVQAMGQSMRSTLETGGQSNAQAQAQAKVNVKAGTVQDNRAEASAGLGAANPFAQVAMDSLMNPALWPWNFMQAPEAEEDGAADGDNGAAAVVAAVRKTSAAAAKAPKVSKPSRAARAAKTVKTASAGGSKARSAAQATVKSSPSSAARSKAGKP